MQRPGGQRARMTIWPEIPGGVGERMKRGRERARKKSGTGGGGRGDGESRGQGQIQTRFAEGLLQNFDPIFSFKC